MPTNYHPDQLKSALERIRLQKEQNDPTVAPLYQTTAPKQLTYQAPENSVQILDRANEKALDTYKAYTSVTEQMQANKQAQEALARAQAAYNEAQGNFVKRGSQKSYSGGGGSINVPGGYASASGVGVGQNLRTMNFRGLRYTVNASVAPKFQGFLKALWNTGYRPKSIGGYNNRNIAGTNTKSLHSYGMAIDIDPSRNPIYYNGTGGRHGLPANVGALAAKYGLSWGGNWKRTKDYMHFSVPYGGRM